jgi:hypothetical protein
MERAEFRIGRDARAVWRAHNEARARGAGEMYTLAQWAQNLPSSYEFNYATIVPKAWPRSHAMTVEEYKSKFEARFGEVAAVIRGTEGVCVCGGAALSPMCDQADDVDVFMFGLDESATWHKANELMDKIRAAFPRAREIQQEMTPGVLTARVYDGSTRLKIQVIMRQYRSMAHVAHSFDIAVCGVAFDGEAVYMTELAAFELLHRVIVVVPEYRSPSFGYRLSKYHRRGFGLVMLDASLPKTAGPFTVGDLRVEPASPLCGRFLVATVSATDDPGVSDYEPSSRVGATRWRNLYQVSTRELRFVVVGSLVGRAPRPLALKAFADAPPTLRDVISKQDLCFSLRDSARASVGRKGQVNVHVLRRVFRLSDAEIAAFAVAASRAVLDGRRVDASEALRRFSTPILAFYDALPQRIEWVCALSPSSSRTHTPKTPEAWYGGLFARPRPPTKAEILAMLHARMCASHGERGALDGTCALCFGAVHGGGENSVTLRCRHTFHFSETASGCRGLCAWTEKNDACPLCRQAFAHAPEAGCSSLPLQVAWP